MTIEPLASRTTVCDGFALWNDQHPDFHIRPRLIEQNVYAPYAGLYVVAMGRFEGDELVSFGVAKTLTRPVPDYADDSAGWITLAVADFDRPSGAALLHEIVTALETHLAARGVTSIRFGADPQHFLPGLPTDLESTYGPVLEDLGYEAGETYQDLAGNIDEFEPPARVQGVADDPAIDAHPVAPDEEAALLSFLESEFPGRWAYEAENVRRFPGGAADYWLCWRDNKPIGFARTSHRDSASLGPNVTWGRRLSLGGAYGGLGPIGIAANQRGNGYGLYLMSEIITTLRRDGIERMAIDWTTLIDYYGKFGFEPWIEYRAYRKAGLDSPSMEGSDARR